MHVRVEIDATPAVVWREIAAIEHHVTWMADAESIEFTTEQRRGVGTRFVCRTRIGPIRVDDVMEVAEWEPETAIGVRHTGIVSGIGRFTLTPIDLARRTRFEWAERLHFPWYLGGRLGAAIGGPTVLARIWQANLARLCERIESAAPQAPPYAADADG